MNFFVSFFMASTALISFSEYCYAWGERGHDLVTRIAARILIHSDAKESSLGDVFVTKEHMLAHLSNVPDIVWRSMGEEIETQNAPTHYLDLEYITINPLNADLPKNKTDLEAAMKALCSNQPKGYKCPDEKNSDPKADMAGTAPYRIQQLTTLMQESFQKALVEQKKAEPADNQIKKYLDDALFYGGILSHFVGDLANPYHTTRDYDGYEINQGGVHSYFESDVVNTFDLGFDMEVFTQAKKLLDLKALMAFTSKSKSHQYDYLEIAFAQTKESFSHLKTVRELDLKHAVEKLGNIDKGLKIKALRKPASQVAAHFRPVIRDRIAQGAATLSWLWRQAWINGGRPNLSKYRSYDYRTTPEFIPTNF